MQVKLADIRIGERYRKDMGDIEGLARSMNEIGLLHPVAIDADYRLIAGERRILAARLLGWESIDAHFVDLENLLQGERDENAVRKDFAPSEAVAIGRALEPLEREAARERQLAGQPSVNFTEGSGQALDKVASTVGMSRPTYAKAQEVVEAAEQEPGLFGDLVAKMDDSGKVDGAHKELKKRLKAQAKAAMPEAPLPDNCILLCDDFRNAQIEPASVDLILTDPPYPREYVPLYADLVRCAAIWLKPGGSLVVMCGQSYLPEILASMAGQEGPMQYAWTLAYMTPGGQSPQIWPRKVNTFWKPVLWFTKGEYAGDWIGDVTKSDGNDKRFHEWGQSEAGMADLLDRFSYPGWTVCDPFVGGGTTAVVAIAMGRRFIGIDCDTSAIDTTRQRLANASTTGTDGLARSAA